MPRENTPLLPPHNDHHAGREKSNFEQAMSLLKAFPDGMAKTYATFGPVAILYHQGLWLIAPVMIGGTISISEEAFAVLKKRYPDNKLVQLMAAATKQTNQTLIGFLEDFGFTSGMMITVAAHFGGIKYYTNTFAKVIAPIASAIPAGVIRYVRNQHNDHKKSNLVLETFGRTFYGANSPVFIVNLLQQQNVVGPQSMMPTITMLGAGIVGLFSGLLHKTHPKISLVLNSLIEMLMEPASLAAIFFAFPNDIFAATHHDEIKEGFFYTNAVVSSGYLLLLVLVNVMAARHEWQEINEEEPLDLIDLPGDEEQPLLAAPEPLPVSVHGEHSLALTAAPVDQSSYSSAFFRIPGPGTTTELMELTQRP